MLYRKILLLFFISLSFFTTHTKAQVEDSCFLEQFLVIPHCIDSLNGVKTQFFEIIYQASDYLDSLELVFERPGGREVVSFANSGRPFWFNPKKNECDPKDSIYSFILRDKNNPMCNLFYDWKVICCEEAECPIDKSQGSLTTEVECTRLEGVYNLFVDFKHDKTLPNKYFSLTVRSSGPNNVYLQKYYKYSDLPLKIEGLYANCQGEYDVTVSDPLIGQRECALTELFFPAKCCSDSSYCDWSNLEVEKLPCYPTEKKYSVRINFKHKGVDKIGSFFVTTKSYRAGPFKYSQLPLTVSGLTADCKTKEFIQVSDSRYPRNCQLTEKLGIECCGDSTDCKLWDLEVIKSPCDSGGFFSATINFRHINTGTFFKIVGNGRDYGTFHYSNLPVHLRLKGDCQTPYEFVILDRGEDECTVAEDLGVVCCGGHEDCNIRDMYVRKSECDDDGFFFAYIGFQHSNTSKRFHILGNGKNYGTFEYSQLPVKLRLKGDCQTPYEFIVQDEVNMNCGANTGLGKVCCEDDHNSEDCSICDLSVDTFPCHSDGTFAILIRANHMGGNGAFFVQLNGQLHGPFKYSQLPVKIEGLHGDCHTKYKVVMYDRRQEHCGAVYNFGPICCKGDPCPLNRDSIFGRAIECNPDHKTVRIFIKTPLPNTAFDVFDRDSFVGFFHSDKYGEISIGHYPISGKDYEYARICLNDIQPPCCKEIEFKAIKCMNAVIDVNQLVDNIHYSWVDESVVIKQSETSDLRIQILNLDGKILLNKETKEQIVKLNIRSAPPGLYLVKVTNGLKNATYRFIKSR